MVVGENGEGGGEFLFRLLRRVVEGGDENVAGFDALGQGLRVSVEPLAGFVSSDIDGGADALGDEFFLADPGGKAVAEIFLVGDALGFHASFEFAFALETGDEELLALVDLRRANREWRGAGLDLETEQFVVDEFF